MGGEPKGKLRGRRLGCVRKLGAEGLLHERHESEKRTRGRRPGPRLCHSLP